MNDVAEKSTGTSGSEMLEKYEISGPWWLILIAGIITLAFGIVLFAWPLMTVSFIVIFFSILSIIFGLAALIRSFTLIKKEKTWWVVLIEGILSIAIGVIVLIWPLSSTIIIIYFIGAWLIVTGITAIAHGSSAKDTLSIVNGVISIMLGVFILFRPPFYAATILILFVGFFAIFRGISMIISSITIKIIACRAAKEAVKK